MGGGGKTGIDALARASGHSPPHGGVYSGLGNERAKPLAFQLKDRTAIQPITAPLQRREAAGCPARAQVRQRASGNEKGRSASGSAQETPHPQERAARDRVRLQNSRSASLLLIVTRMGRDYRPGPRQWIEQVARRQPINRD